MKNLTDEIVESLVSKTAQNTQTAIDLENLIEESDPDSLMWSLVDANLKSAMALEEFINYNRQSYKNRRHLK